MSVLSAPIKTSKDLANAAYDDFKRKAIDEAKKRAVGQHVDYETFKNMVLVAHLKPLSAQVAPRIDASLPSWSFSADGTRTQLQHTVAVPGAAAMPRTPPATSGDFSREWRKCPAPDPRYQYIKLCGPALLQSLFKVEINVLLLKELIAVLEACWLGHAGAAEDESHDGGALREAHFVVQVLTAFTSAGRFSLTTKLLGSSSKPVLSSLFDSLEVAIQPSQQNVLQLIT
ncbi:MAG: hypothetical protein WDW36_006480 [Sanguina aurantia]